MLPPPQVVAESKGSNVGEVLGRVRGTRVLVITIVFMEITALAFLQPRLTVTDLGEEQSRSESGTAVWPCLLDVPGPLETRPDMLL